MKVFLNALTVILFFSIVACEKSDLEGVYELRSNPGEDNSLFNIEEVEKLRCSFIREVRFIGDMCFIKYELLNAPMNLSSKYEYHNSIVSFNNPQFSEFGLGFFEAPHIDTLVLGNCIFIKNSNELGNTNLIYNENNDTLLNRDKNNYPKLNLEEAHPLDSKTKTTKSGDQPKPSVNEAVTTKPSPIRGEVKATEQTNKPEPVKTETAKPVVTPAKEEAKETVQKALEKPKIDQRVVMGAGVTSVKGTTPASGGAQGTSTEKGDEGDPKGTVDGRAIMGVGSVKGTNLGDGFSLDLAGWDFAQRPNINDRFSTRNGRIVFKITIDEKGRVVQAVPLEYNVSNDVLAYYRQVVNQISFKKQGGAAAEFSTGKITFVIKVD